MEDYRDYMRNRNQVSTLFNLLAIEESKVGNIMNDGKNALKEKDVIAACHPRDKHNRSTPLITTCVHTAVVIVIGSLSSSFMSSSTLNALKISTINFSITSHCQVKTSG